MITSIFRKSTLLNNSLVVILLLVFFFLFQTSDFSYVSTSNSIEEIIARILLLLGSMFLVNFIAKRNNLTKDSTFSIFLFLLFILIFPRILENTRILFANFFMLLAMRKIVSLQTLSNSKQKIFDASMWIFVASLFHFWGILFIVLLYISIIFHVSRDFRNWLIPFVAFCVTAVIFLLAALVFNDKWIGYILVQTKANFDLNYFTKNYQNLAISLYAVITVYFLMAMIFTITKKPLVIQASYKKMIFAIIIGMLVFLISPEKNNTLLFFTLFPLAIIGTNNIEYSKNKIYQDVIMFVLVASCVFCFFYTIIA